jgi:mRNA interferase MazF
VIRGEVYRVRDSEPLRGHKPGYYVIVSRNFIATTEDISTVICAPVYSTWRNLETEVPIDEAAGVEHASSIRCDFLMLLRKDSLKHLVGRLSISKLVALERAISVALDLGVAPIELAPKFRRK